MSRIGRLPIPVPSGVEVTIDGREITVKGPKGTLSHTVVEPISIERDGETLVVTRPDDERDSRARHGLTRSLVANMVTGVTAGYEKTLEIVAYRLPRHREGPRPRVRARLQPRGPRPGAGGHHLHRRGPDPLQGRRHRQAARR